MSTSLSHLSLILSLLLLFLFIFCCHQTNATDAVKINTNTNNGEITFDSKSLHFVVDPEKGHFKVSSSHPQHADFHLKQTFGRTGHWAGINLHVVDGYLTRIGFVKWWHYMEKVRDWKLVDENHLRVVTGVSWDSDVTFTVDIETHSEHQFRVKMKVDDPKKEYSYNRIASAFEVADSEQGFYGFGERFNHVNQRGKQLSNWIEEFSWAIGWIEPPHKRWRFPDKETATYIPIPYFMTNRGYGMLLNTNYRSTFDLAHQYKDQFWVQAETTELDFTIFLGNPAQILKQYTDYTGGTSLIPPPWALGPWSQLNGEFTEPAVKDPVKALQKFISMDIPVSHSVDTIHFMPHQSQKGREKQLTQMNEIMNEYGVKQTCYFNPFIQTNVDLYQEALAKDLFVKTEDGSAPFTFTYHGSSNFKCSMLDFSNPATITFYQNLLQESVDLGFKGFMLDYGDEYAIPETLFFNGSKGDEMHNPHVLLYQQTVFDFFTKLDENPHDEYAPDYVFYQRSGYTGTQSRVWSTWTGDPSSDFSFASGYPAQVAAMLNMGLTGITFSGSDIGGFEWLTNPWFKPPSEELWIRWSQLGAFSGLMHDQTGPSNEVTKKSHILDTEQGRFAWRKLSKLRTQLFPYIWTMAHIYKKTSMPIMRHHLLSFPQEAESHKHSYQYLFGDSLLVAPVLDEGATQWTVYLPDSDQYWYDLTSNLLYNASGNGAHRVGNVQEDGAVLQGGTLKTVNVTLQEIPLFARAGSIVPLTDASVFTLSKVPNGKIRSFFDVEHIIHLWVFPDQGKAETALWDGSHYTLQDSVLSFERPSQYANTSVHTVSIPCPNPQVKVVGAASGQTLPSAGSVNEFYAAPLKRAGKEFMFYDVEFKQLLIRVEKESKVKIVG